MIKILKKIIEIVFTFPIYIYKYTISPLLPNSCRYAPTCSEYSIEAIKKYGPIKGIWLGIKRIIKCNPWGGDGWDPVP